MLSPVASILLVIIGAAVLIPIGTICVVAVFEPGTLVALFAAWRSRSDQKQFEDLNKEVATLRAQVHNLQHSVSEMYSLAGYDKTKNNLDYDEDDLGLDEVPVRRRRDGKD